MTVSLDELLVADPPQAWREAGFAVDESGICDIGGVRIRLVGREAGTGIVGWSLSGLDSTTPSEVDGIATTASDGRAGEPSDHPNGVISIDHVVVLSPDLDRTVAAFAAIGSAPRRERDGELGGNPIRQIFFRFGPVIIEVVGSPGASAEGPSSLWGVTYLVADLDATAAFYGERTSQVKDAVQPGRRITTVRHRDLGMSVRTALISS